MRTPFAVPVLVIAGTLWATWYFGMDLLGWGEPGSAAYRRYEIYNRLAPLILLSLALSIWSSGRLLSAKDGPRRGWGSRVAPFGLTVMALGSVLEFWVLTDASYASGSLRAVGWVMYCLGLAVFYVGSVMLAWALRRVEGLRLASLLIGSWLLAAAAVVVINGLTGTSLPPLAIAVFVCGVGYALLGVGLRGALGHVGISAPKTARHPDPLGP